MTTIVRDDGGLRVGFPGWESIMTGRTELAIPSTAIRGVSIEPGWTSEVLGIRSGLVVSGYRKLGVFTHPSGVRRLVSMTRGRPLLRIAVDRAVTGFDEVLVSTDDAESTAAALRPGVHR